jgi:hypothetical protein
MHLQTIIYSTKFIQLIYVNYFKVIVESPQIENNGLLI